MNGYTLKTIARIRSDFPTKFGIPRQAGIVSELESLIVFEPEYRNAEALRGIEDFSHLWLIWQFSENVRDDWSPTVEELMFRAGIFGALRRRSRFAAYAVSALVFSLYHVWGFAIADPINWIYIIQYIPVSLLLARCYERTNSIWSSIFFHMTVNAVSLQALSMLQDLL